MVRAAVWIVAAALLAMRSTPSMAQVYSCRGYPTRTVTAELKSQAEALRRIERESADRLIGLDTRPYDWLLAQARAAEAAIAVPARLAAEQALSRCRNAIRPMRGDCALAAAALVRVVAELGEGEATADAKAAYAQAMPTCERGFGLTPLETALRTAK